MAAFEAKKAGIEQRHAERLREKEPVEQVAAAATPAAVFGENDIGIAVIKDTLKQIDDFKSFNASDVRPEAPRERDDRFGIQRAESSEETDRFGRWRRDAEEPKSDRFGEGPHGLAGAGPDQHWRHGLHDLAKPEASRSYGWASRADETLRVLDTKT